MNINDLKAELSIKLLELGKAIDAGLPYSELKQIYSEIKELQFRITFNSVQEQQGAENESSEMLSKEHFKSNFKS